MTSAEFQGTVSQPQSENPFLSERNEPDLVSSFKKKQQTIKAQENVIPLNDKISATPKVVEVKAVPVEEKIHVEQINNDNKVKQAPEKVEFVAVKEKELPPKPLRLLGEAFKTYIICEYDGKLSLIDKHAAHERIIYNKMKKNAAENQASQVLLSPVTVTLSKAEYDIVISNISVFAKAGFLVEDFGTGVVIVRECPMLITADEVEDTVVEIAGYLSENRTDAEPVKIDHIYHTAACKAAIKAGFKNSTAEMKVLAEQVLYDDNIRYCPHGRPVLIELSKYELEKQFGRIQ